MKKFRLIFCFFISLLLHAALLFYFTAPDKPRFKKGRSLNELARIPGFQVAGGEILKKGTDKPESSTEGIAPPPSIMPAKKPKPAQESSQFSTQKKVEIAPKLADKTQKDAKNKPQDSPNNTPLESAQLLSQIYAQTPGGSVEVGNAKKTSIYEFQGVDRQTIQDVRELYGEEFGDFGFEEQNFIANNLRHIGRITQAYLRYPPNAGRIGQEGVNALEFYLHPNGDISDLKLIATTGFKLLDRNSQKTIEIAYKDYPRPRVKTLIRIKVTYHLY